ncbi:MAG TPA: radical SAM family heme chaperone HemW [Vicinamibacteria bacterium]|nr:radical SAM family heme chaperone HemW [Vicinamibacteria bacterium]
MTAAAESLGLYVHVPFCEAKCSYCHFAIDPGRPAPPRQDRYVAALLREIAASPGGDADSVYFGGGTPSLLRPDRLARVLDALRGRFSVAPHAEVTLEANPRDLDAAGYRALAKLGVNRLSLGVQSFDDAVLGEMGRLHTARDARQAFAWARAAGFAGVSVDLILGWPGETGARWQRNLAAVAELRPDHVSLYVLEVEGRTLLSHRARQGRLRLPDDDLVADLYGETVAALAALGLERYEISNFARAGQASRHNGKYWDDAPFLGFGLSAHSYVAGRRFWNAATFGAYCRAIEERGSAVAGERSLSARERVEEALFTALRRREGVDVVGFRARYGVDPLAVFGPRLRAAFDARLAEVEAGRLRLTDAGVLLSNEVFQALV